MLLNAIKLYNEESFAEAIKAKNDYRATTNYDLLPRRKTQQILEVSLSVIIVTKNLLHAEECIQSIYDYKPTNFEIIIVNNSDQPPTITQYPNTTIITTGKNIYPSEARNIGAAYSTGKWLYFLDDDAVISPTGVQQLIKILKRNDIHAARGKITPKDTIKFETPTPPTTF